MKHPHNKKFELIDIIKGEDGEEYSVDCFIEWWMEMNRKTRRRTQTNVLWLRSLGFSYGEIGKIIGKSRERVRQHLIRGSRENLRNIVIKARDNRIQINPMFLKTMDEWQKDLLGRQKEK